MRCLLTFFCLFAVTLNLAAAKWQIKASTGFTPEDARKISLSGVMPPGSKTVNIKDGTVFPLAKVTGHIKRGTKLRTIAGTVIRVSDDCEKYIGIGADWFFTCFINGEEVLSTEPGGNGSTRISAYNHIAKVKLKKGENHLTLFIRPFLYQWKFSFRIIPEPKELPPHETDRKQMLSQLFPPANPGLLRKELLHQVTENSAAFCWEFGKAVISGIRYRKSGAPADQPAILRWNTRSGKRIVRNIHRVTLEELSPDTGYSYEIVLLDTNTAKISTVSSGSFKTFPATGVNHRFIAISDTQVLPESRMKAIKNMLALPEAQKADFMVSLGDVTENFTNFRQHYFNFYLNILHKNRFFKPVITVKGNHEYRGNDSEVYYDFFGRSYYAFRHGEVFYIVLDTGEGGNTVWAPSHHLLWTDTEQLFREQQKFLEKVISSPACKNAKYRIVLAHASPFRLHAPFYAKSVRQLTEKFFFGTSPRCRIDLWLCAHVHYASRFDPVLNTLYLAADAKYKAKYTNPADFREIDFTVITNDGPGQGGEQLSVTAVEVTPEGLHVKIMTPEGKLLDEAVIQPGKPHRVLKTVLKKLN